MPKRTKPARQTCDCFTARDLAAYKGEHIVTTLRHLGKGKYPCAVRRKKSTSPYRLPIPLLAKDIGVPPDELRRWKIANPATE